MTEKLDVIIVGAGPGGLTAGSILSQQGLSVLVLDRNDHPGGTTRSFTCNGFTFPTGPLGFSNPTTVLNALGASPGSVESAFKPAPYLIHAFGKEIPISLPPALLANELCRLYPREADAIRAFLADSREVSDALLSTPEGELPRLARRTDVSASDYLTAHVKDSSLRKILGSIGSNEPVFGFPLLATMWDIISARGIWYPKGGFNSFAGWIAAEIARRGCRVSLGSEVLGITVRNGKVRGVTLVDGSSIEAPAVISNADFKTTFLSLVESACQPPEWRNAVMEARETSSNLQVCLGVDKSKVDLSVFSTATRIIYRGDAVPGNDPGGPDWKAPEMDPRDLAGEELEVCLWSGDDPSLAPPGAAVVVIRVAADHAHFNRFRPEWGKRIPEYARYKARLAGSLVREVSKLLPGLEQAVLISDVATPLTFEERGGRYAGAVAGWSQRHQDVLDYAVRPLVLTPIDGLYMAGLQAFSWLYWGGVPSAVLSGARAADAVLRGDDPVNEVWVPGSRPGRTR